MEEMVIQGVRVRSRNGISPLIVDNLTNTLTIVPAAHRSLLRQVDVLPPANFGHGDEYAGGGSGVGWPRLSELCFDRRYRPHNFPLNRTLLHEIGHIVSQHYQCLSQLGEEYREVINGVPIPPTAHTRGPEEHYAIAYEGVFSGSAYGTAAVREALYASRAFEGISI